MSLLRWRKSFVFYLSAFEAILWESIITIKLSILISRYQMVENEVVADTQDDRTATGIGFVIRGFLEEKDRTPKVKQKNRHFKLFDCRYRSQCVIGNLPTNIIRQSG